MTIYDRLVLETGIDPGARLRAEIRQRFRRRLLAFDALYITLYFEFVDPVLTALEQDLDALNVSRSQ